MESFTANFLANLAAELSAVLLPALGRRLQAALVGDEAAQALQRSLHAALVALLAQASADSPDYEALLADIFRDFFQQDGVTREIALLLRGQAWDLDELALLFADAGYDAKTLPGLDFAQGMEAFAAAFLVAIAAEPALQNTLQTHQLLAQTRLQQALLAQMEQLVRWLQQAGAVRIHAGNIVAENAAGAAPSSFPWPGRAAADDSARTAYLAWLMTERGNLPLRAISSGKTGGPERPPELAKVYVALNTTAANAEKNMGSRLEEQSERAKPISALAALAKRRRIVLLGDPGSGKSTFVSHLAYCLAAHALYPAGGWLAQLAEWPADAAGCLPVLVVLRDFARWLPQPLPAKAHAHHLWDFIASTTGKEKLEDALPLLHQALTDGQALLLLDGLDEVTTPAQRRFVRDAVHAFSQRYAGCYLLVTCRPFSYLPPDKERGEEELRLPAAAYTTFSLAPFEEAQQDAFVRAWYQELKRQGHLPGLDEARLSQDLQRAIRRSDLRRVAGNPLLLTVMAMVHVEEGRLPDSRALLYNKTIDLLLSRWEETKSEDETPLLRQLLQQANRTDGDLKARLAAVAFAVHTQGGSAADNEQVADIGETVLCQELSGLHQKDLGWGQQLLGVIKTRAGLLIERSPGQFAFPHRTFQEYLAGVHLASQPDFPKQALTWAQQGPGWWPMALFAVEHLVYVSQRPLDPLPLISNLCPEKADETTMGWQLTWLAGDALLGLGRERAEDNEWGRQLLERARQRLADLLDGGHLAVAERAAAGRTLAQLGDPRRGVGWLVQDGRRIPDIVWGEEVPAGTYTIGGDKGAYLSFDKRSVQIKQPYRLSRYPVTYAQFQCFLDAPDFDDDVWWAGMPAMVKPYSDAYPLRELGEQAFPFANHPRERVSWYQAVAFCRWLSAQVGYIVELPHEHEWEVAARWPDNRFYPWGNDFAADKANTSESSLNSTTAVGMYPAGRNAALALYDLSGNVWEWCRNKYDRPDDDQIDGSEARRVLRGGAWNHDSSSARATYRDYDAPADRYLFSGFRLVCSRRPPSH